MHSNILIFLLLAFTASSSSLAMGEEIRTFQEYKRHFGKRYESREVEARKERSFLTTLKRLDDLELQNPTAEFGLNEYSDMSRMEFETLFPEALQRNSSTIEAENSPQAQETKVPRRALPLNYDWREHLTMSPVQSQGYHCGSCWAFSSVAAVEAQLSRHGIGQGIVLSKQEIVDCSDKSLNKEYRSHGCHGGYETDTYGYIHKNGIMEERYYPYTGASNESCLRDSIWTPRKFHVASWRQLPWNRTDAEIMQTLVEHGPLTCDILADHEAFRHYKRGIIRNTDINVRHTNHSVLLVGFGYNRYLNVYYWIIRNSWGTHWGEGGFARIERGYNQLGINNLISYPILNPTY